jgi:hypothetical protein
MLKPVDFFARLTLHQTILSHLRPSKWGWWEPASNAWDIGNLEALTPKDRNGLADRVIWIRESQPKAEGNFATGSFKAQDPLGSHGIEWIHCELAQFVEKPMVEYIQQSVLQLDGNLAFIHFVADQEKPAREIEGKFGVGSDLAALSIYERTIRHWLPELPWATVFGAAYVRMFGLEKLLTAPAYEVIKLSDEAVYIQLSPKLTDLINDYATVNQVREAVKNHIGRDAFFDQEKAYPLNSPLGACTGEELMAFKPAPPMGTVFRVPDFQLIDDGFVQSA